MRTSLLIGLFIIGLVCSCRFLDIVENHYKGYEDAIENDFNGDYIILIYPFPILLDY